MSKIVEMQCKLEKQLDVVLGNQDYVDLVADLEAIEDFINKSSLDRLFMTHFIELAESRSSKALSVKKISKLQFEARFILRSSILRKHLNLPLRSYAIALAATPLYQSFCGIYTLGEAIPSKSNINSLENSISEELLKKANVSFLKDTLLDREGSKSVGLQGAFNIEELYGDTTCVKANIHFPVDWVLFRDMIRTSALKINMIRSGGIKARMPQTPNEYLSDINSLCMEMHSNYNTTGAVKKRKKTFRKMKKLLNVAMGHADRHLELFKRQWMDFEFSGTKATSIINCLEGILNRKEEVVKIAHERIIGERVVNREDKILSIYENEVHIIKRKKHSVSSEFGNTLQIIEQADGFIIEYDLLEDYSPGDQKLGMAALENIKENFGLKGVIAFTGDRGYDSKEVLLNLEKLNQEEGVNISSGITPKDVTILMEKMKDPDFKARQKRRANTEAKIAHIKWTANNPMKQKGIRNRKIHLGLSVLTRNIFKLAGILRTQQAEKSAA